MYIHRIIIRGMKNSPDRDLTFYNDWRDEPLHSILITGPNGSGKTTLLRIISVLWDSFGTWLESGFTRSSRFLHSQGNLLRAIDLVAIEIRDLPELKADMEIDKKQSLWLYIARSPEERDKAFQEIKDSGQTIFIGEVRSRSEARGRLDVKAHDRQWFDAFADELERSRLGVGTIALPNVIFLDAENRQIPAYQRLDAKREQKTQGEFYYQWLVTYGLDRDEQHLETRLRYFKLRDAEAFAKMLESINMFFGNQKQLLDYDRNNTRLRVRTVDDPKNVHYIEDLSSGEKQCVLLIYMVSRWLMTGGIVVIDEPDLYLHVSLQRHLIRTLEQIVKVKKGQIIVTSHSPTIWEEYYDAQRFTLGVEVWEKQE